MGELKVAPGLTFKQTVEAKEKAAELFIKKFQHKIDQVENFKGKTKAYMVFDSKVNEIIKNEK